MNNMIKFNFYFIRMGYRTRVYGLIAIYRRLVIENTSLFKNKGVLKKHRVKTL